MSTAMTKSSEGSESPATYFRQTHPVFMAAIAFCLMYHSWVVFSPESFPYEFLGPIGTVTCYLVENHKLYVDIWYAIVWLIHIVEALYCIKLCRDKGITDLATQFRWVIQTLCFGLMSFILLLLYNPPEEESKNESLDLKKKEN